MRIPKIFTECFLSGSFLGLSLNCFLNVSRIASFGATSRIYPIIFSGNIGLPFACWSESPGQNSNNRRSLQTDWANQATLGNHKGREENHLGEKQSFESQNMEGLAPPRFIQIAPRSECLQLRLLELKIGIQKYFDVGCSHGAGVTDSRRT